jgi:thymidylate synthase (FAD)
VARWCPIAWEAFLDYQFHSLAFSQIELAVLEQLGAGNPKGAIDAAVRAGIVPTDLDVSQRNREREELEEKLRRLNLPIPWQPKKENHRDTETQRD